MRNRVRKIAKFRDRREPIKALCSAVLIQAFRDLVMRTVNHENTEENTRARASAKKFLTGRSRWLAVIANGAGYDEEVVRQKTHALTEGRLKVPKRLVRAG